MLDLYYVLAISSDDLLSSDRLVAQYIILGPYPHNIKIHIFSFYF